VKKVIVRTVPRPSKPGGVRRVLGHLIDDGNGDPRGSNRLVDDMLGVDRRAKFDFYAGGWSNGYLETLVED
jgi:hypothetical protein